MVEQGLAVDAGATQISLVVEAASGGCPVRLVMAVAVEESEALAAGPLLLATAVALSLAGTAGARLCRGGRIGGGG